MLKKRSQIIDETIGDFKQARDHVPERSREVFDNVTLGGEVLSSLFKIGETVIDLHQYHKERKRIKDDTSPRTLKGS